MIDIDRVFNIQKESNKNNTQGISITNPILYIFIGGNGFEVLNEIYNFNEKKGLNSTGAVEYINISKTFCDFVNNNNIILSECEEEGFIERRKTIYEEFDRYEDIFKIISYIELKFLEHSYTMPVKRRVHFIVEAYNEYSCILDKIIEVAKNFFISRNLVPIIDIFLLINDKPDNTESQKASTYMLLQECKLLKNDINMIYILSNINSSRTVSKETEIYTSIARTAMIKEFDYNKQPYDFSYDEGKIIDNTKNVQKDKRGIFYSLGLKTIERPKDAINFIALNALIDENLIINEDIINDNSTQLIKGFIKILNDISKRPLNNDIFIQKENISSVMIDNEVNFYNCDTNIDLINTCFHNNLDKYFEYNADTNLSFDKALGIKYIDEQFKELILNSNIGYFAAVKILKNMSAKLIDIKKSLIQSKDEIQSRFDNWKQQKFVYKKRVLEDKYQPIFNLAKDYIMQLYKLFAPSVALKAFENFEITLNNLINQADLINKELKATQNKLTDMTNSLLLDTKGEIVKINFVDYYTNLVKKYIKSNYNDYFKNVYSKIYDLGLKDINDFYIECIKYINKILESKEFNLNVYDEILNRLLNDENNEYNESLINDLFNKEITDNKFYYIKLINENNFYSNICVLTDNNSVINKISNSEINYIVYSSESKLEILYFIGAFNDDSLAYINSYKLAYDNFNKEVLKDISIIEGESLIEKI